MGSSMFLKLLITLILLAISCSAQQDDVKEKYGIKSITQGPSNAVGETGNQVILTCTANAPIGYWVFSKDGTDTDMLTIVGPGCSVNSPFGDHYEVESLGGGTTCNLIVFNITMEQAGVYGCAETQNKLFSVLTVIDSPAATVNTTEPVVEKENVIITCSLSYEGPVAPAPTLRPYFYWKDINDRDVDSSYNLTTENTAVSQLIVTAAAHFNITPYTCHVYFQLMPPDTANYANNIPSDDISAMSPTIEVYFSARIGSMSERSEYITIGGITCEVKDLQCGAYGNPRPTYEWFDTLENLSISKIYKYSLAEIDRKYTCVASNTIRNVVYSDTQVINGHNRSITQDCKFPRSESTWISVTPVQGCGNGTCACSSDYDGFTLLCNAISYPSAIYQWIGADNNTSCPRIYENVQTNGIYRCSTYFDQASSSYRGNFSFPNGTSEKSVTECYQFKGAELPTA